MLEDYGTMLRWFTMANHDEAVDYALFQRPPATLQDCCSRPGTSPRSRRQADLNVIQESIDR